MTEPTEPVNYTPYEPTSASYGDIPPIPPPPSPSNKRPWWHIGVPVLMVVALVALIVVPHVALGKKPAPTTGVLQTPTATIAPTQQAAPTVPPTMTDPTPTVNTTVMSSVPLIEPGANNWFYCYVVPDDTNSDGVYARLSNPDQHRVYEDCKSFMSYGPYFSVQLVHKAKSCSNERRSTNDRSTRILRSTWTVSGRTTLSERSD